MSEIVFCASTMGRQKIFAIVIVENVTKLSQLKENIKGHPTVREVTTSIWVDEILLCPENFELDRISQRKQ